MACAPVEGGQGRAALAEARNGDKLTSIRSSADGGGTSNLPRAATPTGGSQRSGGDPHDRATDTTADGAAAAPKAETSRLLEAEVPPTAMQPAREAVVGPAPAKTVCGSLHLLVVLKTPGTPLVLCRRLGDRLVLPSLRDSASYQLDGVEAVRALLQHTLAEPAALRQAVEGGRYAQSMRTADGATAHAIAFTVGCKMRVPPRASGTWRWTPYAGALRGDAVEGSAP